MLEITTATPSQLLIISNLATQIWWDTYSSFISEQQITFMLNDMYSPTALRNQMANHHIFKLFSHKNKYCGFASYAKTHKPEVYKIEKLYLHQTVQGIGLGKIILLEIEKELLELNATEVQLNVNRANKAQYFYLKMGYQILQIVDIPYHKFILNDFVMTKYLKAT